jgi:alpha-tubulin suppressor-like RCC1 family protein
MESGRSAVRETTAAAPAKPLGRVPESAAGAWKGAADWGAGSDALRLELKPESYDVSGKGRLGDLRSRVLKEGAQGVDVGPAKREFTVPKPRAPLRKRQPESQVVPMKSDGITTPEPQTFGPVLSTRVAMGGDSGGSRRQTTYALLVCASLLTFGCGRIAFQAVEAPGADASTIDAAVHDQGAPTDGGGDSGAEDSGTPDAGTGALDGSADAALVDAGVVVPASLLTPYAGPRTSGFLSSVGQLRCFGAGGDGQLGEDPATLSSSCDGVACESFAITFALQAITAAAMTDRSMCVARAGAVWCVGSNRFGELALGAVDGNTHATAREANVSGTIVEFAAGRHHVCGRRDNGTVACWGLGNHGALGVDPAAMMGCGAPADALDARRLGVDEGTPLRCTGAPVEVPNITDAIGLRAGPFATCVLRVGGGALCFGRNVSGSLGVGTTPATTVAAPTALRVVDAVDVALGEHHGCAVDSVGVTHCFGLHDRGQLGIGSALDTCMALPCAPLPTPVGGLGPASRVLAGDDHTCVLKQDGALSCFGSDLLGQVGDDDGANDDCAGAPCARTPRDVTPAARVARAVAAGDHTLLILVDGTPMAFGGNRSLECGRANGLPVPWPSPIFNISP